MRYNDEGEELSSTLLLQLGFERNEQEDEDEEIFVTWHFDGIELHQDMYSEKESFSFATRTREDGSFKSGYSISTECQLENLYYSLTNRRFVKQETKRDWKMNPAYAPPKEIGSAIRSGFDYMDDEIFNGQSCISRSYEVWQHLLVVLKGWIKADEENFLDYIKKEKVDPDYF